MRRLVPLLAACAALAGLAAPPATAAPGTWTPTLPLPQQGQDLLSAFPNGTAYLEHTNGGGNLLLRSTDFGQTWTPFEAPMGNGTAFVRFATPKLGYSLPLGDTRAYRTVDGAASWQPAAAFPVKRGERFAAGTLAVSGSSIVVTGTLGPASLVPSTKCVAQRGAVMTSHDRGATWRRFVLPGGQTRAAGWSARLLGSRDAIVTFYEEDDVCTTSFDQNAVWVTHDGGRTYTRRAVCKTICTAVGLASRDRLLVGRVDGTTAISENGGKTFREGPRFTDYSAAGGMSHAFWVQSFHFVGRVGYASTKGGGTWRTTSGGHEWVQELSHEAGFGLGIGDIAAFTETRAITAGPSFVSVRNEVGPNAR